MKAADHKTRDAAAQLAARTATALQAAGCEVPNLDGLSTDPGDLFAAALVFGRLAAYADHKGRAMELRAAGDIPAALSFERAAEAQYAKLPSWAKW
jgi:hypothetical protein